MSIGGMLKCDIDGNTVLPEAAETCACGRDVCERCSNYHNSGEFDCCDVCYKKRLRLTGQMLWEALTDMFPPHSIAPWRQAPKDTQEKYEQAAEDLNRQLRIIE